jgi:hypothetical protein
MIRVEHLTVKQSFTNDSTNEFEVRQVIWVDARMWIGLESDIVRSRGPEKRVARIEHFSR